MAGYQEDPTQWRLRTNLNSIPYKFLDIDGEFGDDNASVNWSVLVPTAQMFLFMTELFPPPLVIGNVAIPQTAGLPGLPQLTARKAKFKRFIDGKPIDPFGADPDAPAGTYAEYVQLDVEFGPREKTEPDEHDPFTFLEISGNTTGEFIHSTMPGSKWQEEETTGFPDVLSAVGALDSEADVQAVLDFWHQNDTQGDKTVTDTPVNRNPTTPVIITIPQTEWTLRWPQIPFNFFKDVLIYRLRLLMGRCNSNVCPWLFGAVPETLLFVGYTYKADYTWRDGLIETPPITCEIKIAEKRVLWNDKIIGHNHFWRPGVGFDRLLIDGVRPAYLLANYNILFKV